MHKPSTPLESQRLLRDITERFGFVPPFFEPAVETPDVLALLWQQTLTAYVDNPLPALFKEKLSALLSRYCAVSYCLVCHSCSLGPLGVRGPQVLRLLQSPVPDEARTERLLTGLSGVQTPVEEFPSPGSDLEEDVLHVVERLVRAHHGRVEVESDTRGTTFCLHLPRGAPVDVPPQKASPLASSGGLPAH